MMGCSSGWGGSIGLGSPMTMGERAASLIWPSSLLVELLRDLTDPDECWFDHHGYCQAHTWLTSERPCPHGRARKLLALVDEEPAGRA